MVEKRPCVTRWKVDPRPLYDWSKLISDYRTDEGRLAALFYKLDLLKDGFVTVGELQEYMESRGERFSSREIEEIIAHGDVKKDGKLDYQEFMMFMLEHERTLWQHFVKLDRDGNGLISHNELLQYKRDNSLDIPADILAGISKRMDENGNLEISFDEFRKFNQFRISYKFSRAYISTGASYCDGVIGRPKERTSKFSLCKTLICGGIAGIASRTMTAPLDRVKTLLQVQGQQRILGSAQGNLTARQVFRGMYAEGFWTMWRGNGVNCLKIFPETAIRYSIFEALNSVRMLSHVGVPRNVEYLLNGGLTGFLVQFVMFPVELVKTRIMTSSGPLSIYPALREIWSEEDALLRKIPKFYRGAGPALFGVVPFAALELGSCKIVTETFCRVMDTRSPGFWSLTLIGLCSQMVAMTATYPFRLVTCQLQASKERQSQGGYQLLKAVWRREGYRGWYRGYLANAMKAGPATGITWGVFSTAKVQYDCIQKYYYDNYG